MAARPAIWIGSVTVVAVGVFIGYEVFFAPTVLEEKRSEYNHILVEEDRDGIRSLRFERGGAIQSALDPEDLRDLRLPYTRGMMTAFAAIDDPRSVLVIGLGGGALPSFLHAVYPELQIDVFELDPAVLEVAERHFGFQQDTALRVMIGDGRRLLEEPDESREDLRYDVIMLDAYGKNSVPAHLCTLEFLRSVRTRLRERGVVAANVWGPKTNAQHDAMLRTYRAAFADFAVLRFEDRGNRIFLAGARLPPDVEQFRLRAQQETEDRDYPFDLAALIERGFQRPTTTDGPLLRD